MHLLSGVVTCAVGEREGSAGRRSRQCLDAEVLSWNKVVFGSHEMAKWD